MYFVYLLESLLVPSRKYVGITDNPIRRLEEHNNGRSTHTNRFKPWKLMTYIAFDDLSKAQAFEKYLKSHSGRAFAKKHL
jgi:predicted GIY-YIG superfamily endonuclease